MNKDTVEYSGMVAIKKNEITSFPEKWIESEISQTKKDKSHMFSFIY
jgi:hypothetical protein